MVYLLFSSSCFLFLFVLFLQSFAFSVVPSFSPMFHVHDYFMSMICELCGVNLVKAEEKRVTQIFYRNYII